MCLFTTVSSWGLGEQQMQNSQIPTAIWKGITRLSETE